ncbi:hypothetical protein J3Q64DRAFT_1776358 [Phycomyces blakesleeanus]|uniref:Uncharacterized protein n=2 Tax=Phycomyces blakesleeanus TaxID=4837 RepID=A0A162WCR3_PHYB8|nr:hypothetical protein PHYBLDRAFT_152622 [Phycomyces blakesleeanus NRRL 1555(-)]OAD66295.1 hypothetical protein PHYBLDRAFT_152622 [Phycomyces blakesleeanus NRRL 1555(-)]|eukprot:XP_018284335.1 hypothetical protein PHYBLDRAFT_152622 [Phycomyces blakesleeanus NRRL 1555(-)]
MSQVEYWRQVCTNAFNGDPRAEQIVMSVEKLNQTTTDTIIITPAKQQPGQPPRGLTVDTLENLGFKLTPSSTPPTYQLPTILLKAMAQTKREAREQWHIDRQIALSRHLDESLQHITVPHVTGTQRLALLQEFSRTHDTNLGSVPFLRAFIGFLEYQLKHPKNLAEWQLSEYALTQNGEDCMMDYIRILRVFGMQLVYRDQMPEQAVAITIEDPFITWRMNDQLSNRDIQDMLKLLPKHTGAKDQYQVSGLPRLSFIEKPQSLLGWIKYMIFTCFSFLPFH